MATETPAGTCRHIYCAAFLALSLAGCAKDAPPPPETHHDPFIEQWLGKSKAQAVAKLGKPTDEVTLSSGESTLMWDYPKSHCSIALNVNKDKKIESGHNSCSPQAAEKKPR